MRTKFINTANGKTLMKFSFFNLCWPLKEILGGTTSIIIFKGKQKEKNLREL